MIGNSYTKDWKPTYSVRDESYTGPDEVHVPRFFLERLTPIGRMSWGITTYTTRESANKAAELLNSIVLDEVP